jgi:mannan endo-1,4-beta-mannosidase
MAVCRRLLSLVIFISAMTACSAEAQPTRVLITITPAGTLATAPATIGPSAPSSIRGSQSASTQTGRATQTVRRPGYNTGTGFFVANGKLYDANGVEFRIRGVNKVHYEVGWPGIPKTRANTIRWVAPLWLAPDTLTHLMQSTIDAKIVPMPGVWYTSDSWDEADNVVCQEEVSYLRRAVDLWLAQATTLKRFERYLLVNIASEWGPGDSPVWRDAYIKAVADLRAAGYLGTLVIDAGGCGQNPADIIRYGQEVFNSDPQRNILFDVHVYGLWSDGNGEAWQTDLMTGFDGLANTGLPILIGEFGPGRDIGPSPTLVTPGQIITASEAHGFGWLAWAWDDPASDAPDDWFALSLNGDYNSSADLTTFGKEVIEDPVYGLLQLARPATLFAASP